jgi:quercetin dioxygenase-like cupin family protein
MISLFRLGIFDNNSFDLVELNPKNEYHSHRHKKSKAKFYIVFGEGKIILNKRKKSYKKGDVFNIGKGVSHGFEPKSKTLFLSVQTPPIKNAKTGKEDIHFDH